MMMLMMVRRSMMRRKRRWSNDDANHNISSMIVASTVVHLPFCSNGDSKGERIGGLRCHEDVASGFVRGFCQGLKKKTT